MGRWAGVAVAQMLQGPAQKGLGGVQTVEGAGAPTGGADAMPAGQWTCIMYLVEVIAGCS